MIIGFKFEFIELIDVTKRLTRFRKSSAIFNLTFIINDFKIKIESKNVCIEKDVFIYLVVELCCKIRYFELFLLILIN